MLSPSRICEKVEVVSLQTPCLRTSNAREAETVFGKSNEDLP